MAASASSEVPQQYQSHQYQSQSQDQPPAAAASTSAGVPNPIMMTSPIPFETSPILVAPASAMADDRFNDPNNGVPSPLALPILTTHHTTYDHHLHQPQSQQPQPSFTQHPPVSSRPTSACTVGNPTNGPNQRFGYLDTSSHGTGDAECRGEFARCRRCGADQG